MQQLRCDEGTAEVQQVPDVALLLAEMPKGAEFKSYW